MTRESPATMRAAASLLTVLALALSLVATGTTAYAQGGHVDVKLNADGPWTAQLVGFDPSRIREVDYYVRDATGRWRSLPPATSAPFDAELDWWLGDNRGMEAVAAHVHTTDGSEIRDPGGWHWVNGEHANPRGALKAMVNADGSAGAVYVPESEVSVIEDVNFFYRDRTGHWVFAGTGDQAEAGSWQLDAIPGTESQGWQGDKDRVSVHVVWRGGKEWIDPVRPVDRASFEQPPPPQPAPTASAGAVAPTCRPGDPLAGIYHPTRLAVLAPCARFRGTVIASLHEEDGDRHLWIAADPGYDAFLNGKNVYEGKPALVAEIVPSCSGSPVDSTAAAACPASTIAAPPVGSHIEVIGPWVLDRDHGWQEIHPVNAVTVNPPPVPVATPTPSPTPTATPLPPPPPTRVPATPVPQPPPVAAPPPAASCYPRTNAGNCYQPGEFCRTSDHNVIGLTADGRRIQCLYNNGWRWEPI